MSSSHAPFLAVAATLALASCASPPAPAAATPALSSARTAAPVTLTYLGVAGWKVDDGDHTLLVDPYVSRLEVGNDSGPLVPDADAIAKYIPARADLVLVSHSHYDHLLDVPSIASRTGATVVGTESTLNVARAANVPEAHLRLAHPGEPIDEPPFSVRPISGLHGLVGLPNTPIPAGVALPMKAEGYTEGGTLDYVVRVEGRTILFISSANFIDAALEGLRPDVAVLAVGLREKIPDYSCRLMRALGRPPVVLTNHFDAHWEPLGPKQMNIDDPTTLTRFADEIHECSPSTKVIVPQHLKPMAI